mmetsp:Transcript_12293/g.29820  ORF Transcript_12293/g.29820 Transcript_12293/m.29820 type:complete len:219 (+) Transcript_12293:2803-3459(+)
MMHAVLLAWWRTWTSRLTAARRYTRTRRKTSQLRRSLKCRDLAVQSVRLLSIQSLFFVPRCVPLHLRTGGGDRRRRGQILSDNFSTPSLSGFFPGDHLKIALGDGPLHFLESGLVPDFSLDSIRVDVPVERLLFLPRQCQFFLPPLPLQLVIELLVERGLPSRGALEVAVHQTLVCVEVGHFRVGKQRREIFSAPDASCTCSLCGTLMALLITPALDW